MAMGLLKGLLRTTCLAPIILIKDHQKNKAAAEAAGLTGNDARQAAVKATLSNHFGEMKPVAKVIPGYGGVISEGLGIAQQALAGNVGGAASSTLTNPALMSALDEAVFSNAGNLIS